MSTKTTVAGVAVGAVGLMGAIVGGGMTNDVVVKEDYRFTNTHEYMKKRDEVFKNIEARIAYKKDGTSYLNFGNGTIDYREFSDMYNFLNYEKERCGMKFGSHDFAKEFLAIKAGCKK